MPLPVGVLEGQSSQGGSPVGQLELALLDGELGLPGLQLGVLNRSAHLPRQKLSKQAGILHLREMGVRLLVLEVDVLIVPLNLRTGGRSCWVSNWPETPNCLEPA